MSNPEQSQHVQRAGSPQPPDDADQSGPRVSGHPSRRQVIAGAGVGLGLVASGALAGAAGGAVLGSGAAPAGSGGGGPAGDVVAHVRDASTGDIDVFFGDQQVRIRDRAVAARLAAVTR